MDVRIGVQPSLGLPLSSEVVLPALDVLGYDLLGLLRQLLLQRSHATKGAEHTNAVQAILAVWSVATDRMVASGSQALELSQDL